MAAMRRLRNALGESARWLGPRTRGVRQAYQRLTRSQSALEMQDVMSLAAPGVPSTELARVYEWYMQRTTAAIRTSYGVAAAALAAAARYVATATPDDFTLAVFGGVVVLAAIVGHFQQAEIAQLPRELAVASRLLITFRTLGGDDLAFVHAPERAERSSRWRGTIIAISVVALTSVVWCLWRKHTDESHLVALVVATALTVIALSVLRLSAEFRASRIPLTDAKGAPQRPALLQERIGQCRLDDYINDPDIARYVDRCIADAMKDFKP